MPRSANDVAADLRGWVASVATKECAALVTALDLSEHAARVRVLAAIVDCVLRRVLPLAKYERFPTVLPVVRALAPVTDRGGRAAARAALRGLGVQGPSAVGSASIALMHLDVFAEAASSESDEAEQAWQSLFYASGCLYMAVWRTRRADVSREEVAVVLGQALRELDEAP